MVAPSLTLFGLVFTPVFYSVVMKFAECKSAAAPKNHPAGPGDDGAATKSAAKPVVTAPAMPVTDGR